MQWIRGRPEQDTEWETSNVPNSLFGWFQDTESGQLQHLVAFSPLTTAGGRTIPLDAIPLDAIRRIICHVILSRLPSRALPEVWESLNDMDEFYAYEPPSPRLTSNDTALIEATIAESVERPTFSIDE